MSELDSRATTAEPKTEKKGTKKAHYTYADLQKAISDERSHKGRERKAIETEVTKKMQATYEEQILELSKKLSYFENENMGLHNAVQAYEGLITHEVETMKSTLPGSHQDRVLPQLEGRNVLEQYQTLRLVRDLLPAVSPRVPRPASSVTTRPASAMEQLTIALNKKG